MKRVILLRFHKGVDIVQNRIDLIRHFNPDIPIYGLFGGESKEFRKFESQLSGLEAVTLLNIKDRETKWRFSDLCILQWYEDFGKDLDFDVVHTIEYDLVILDKLESVYQYDRGEKHIYITNLTDLDRVIPESNWFQNPNFPVEECKEFVDYVKKEYGIKKLYNSKAPGATLTKKYLEGYLKLNLPMTGFDEIRLPAVAQILGIGMKDTGFVKDWFDETSLDFQLFNTDNVEVKKDDLLKAYKNGYKKAFHPVYEKIMIDEIGG